MISLKGSTLNIKGLGSMRLELCLLCALLGGVIALTLICECSSLTLENFGTKLNELANGDNLERKALYNPNSTYEKVQIPLPEGQLFYYANNKFEPECCKNSSISGSGGCACETEEQVKFLESRGGNKTYDIKDL
tara:strand:+ start:1033 stop:1437 length:405 start_codon:yes stop_codon:yes gene_type:complete